jgi:SPP1 gp7 family putative phage head morphogenesis protein
MAKSKSKKTTQQVYDDVEIKSAALRKEAAQLRNSIETILMSNPDQPPMIKFGLASKKIDNFAKQMSNQYQGDYSNVVNQLQYNLAAEYGIKLTTSELVALSELVSPALDQIKYESALMKADVKALLLRNLGQGLSFAEIVKGLKDMYPSYERHIYTLTNTSLLNTYKDAHFTKLEENFSYFEYVGPMDSVTRPYCAAHVGKVYTAEEAAGIQATIMGFYNCRHTLEPRTDKNASLNIL